MNKQRNLWQEHQHQIGYIQSLPSGGNYRYLIEKSFATLTLVDNYMTWNLSVQDAVKLKKPSLVFKHDTHKYVLGDDYPLYFENKSDFIDLINKIPEGKEVNWELPTHDQTFEENLVGDLIHCLDNSKKKKTQKLNMVFLVVSYPTRKWL